MKEQPGMKAELDPESARKMEIKSKSVQADRKRVKEVRLNCEHGRQLLKKLRETSSEFDSDESDEYSESDHERTFRDDSFDQDGSRDGESEQGRTSKDGFFENLFTDEQLMYLLRLKKTNVSSNEKKNYK